MFRLAYIMVTSWPQGADVPHCSTFSAMSARNISAPRYEIYYAREKRKLKSGKQMSTGALCFMFHTILL